MILEINQYCCLCYDAVSPSVTILDLTSLICILSNVLQHPERAPATVCVVIGLSGCNHTGLESSH